MFVAETLCSAFINMSEYNAATQDFVPVMDKIRLADPEMKKIWKHSLSTAGRSERLIQTIVALEKAVLERILRGEQKLEEPMLPSGFVPKC